MFPLHRVVALALLCGACQNPTGYDHPGSRPELVNAGAGPVDEVVRGAMASAQHDGRQLLVYVSATWCKPCERFQASLRSGELDSYFPRLRLLKFDHDQDIGRLQVAGYGGDFIPRFVLPGPDGRASDQRIEGGTKAEDTVFTSIGPRLRQMLDHQTVKL
jgi:hypothetical protein